MFFDISGVTQYYSADDCLPGRESSRHVFLSSVSLLKEVMVLPENFAELKSLSSACDAAKMYVWGDVDSAKNRQSLPVLKLYARWFLTECQKSGRAPTLAALMEQCSIGSFLKMATDERLDAQEKLVVTNLMVDYGLSMMKETQSPFSMFLFEKLASLIIGPASHVLRHIRESGDVLAKAS